MPIPTNGPFQGLSQDLETGCPKLAKFCKIFGRLNFQGGPQYTQISIINMYEFIKIRHNILNIQCHGNHMERKKLNYMLEIDISRNSSQTFLGVLRGAL